MPSDPLLASWLTYPKDPSDSQGLILTPSYQAGYPGNDSTAITVLLHRTCTLPFNSESV